MYCIIRILNLFLFTRIMWSVGTDVDEIMAINVPSTETPSLLSKTDPVDEGTLN